MKKFQRQVPKSEAFPCDVRNTRSASRPHSVHKLRPGDIDVIGALGDSLTAGFGATAITPFELSLEERGKSFAIGGEANWKTYVTLPNILKVFNPNLEGYALNTSLSTQEGSQLNVAEGLAISANMPYMTKELIRRIKSDKKINVDED
ncbi:phospholipase B1, membrane-associated-like [Zophobas morio]|uniref:phospholipase B1, membrane-associated-like n=1 Tax=Zophobas morio TaxID=2755281 RepID=UPI003083E3C5